VIAVDIDDGKLALARRIGASHTINSAIAELHNKLGALTDGQGPHVVIEAVGSPATFRLAVEEVCYAGRVVYLGYSKAHVEYDATQFVLKEIDILGSRNALPGDFADVVRTLEAGGFPTAELVTHSPPIDQAADAFRRWSDDPASVTKIQVVLSGEGA
jgi:threonine dehydrogenase-like Zn-dependent dehydrogenase